MALENSVYVYQFQTLDLLEKFSTRENPKGLVALSTGEENVVLGWYPGPLVAFFSQTFHFDWAGVVPLSLVVHLVFASMCVCM